MSRIYEALRRANDKPAADEPAESVTSPEHAAEWVSESELAIGNRLHPPAGPTGRSDKSRERDTFTPAPKPLPEAAAQSPRLSPLLSPTPTASASLADAPTFPLQDRSPLVQQCRRLAGVLHDRQVERRLKKVAIASAVDTAGKAHIAVHLALTLSRTYTNRVLLIDADTQQPFVHELVGGPNDVGLSDALRGDPREIPLIRVTSLFHVLTVGRSASDAPSDLTSLRMTGLVDECAARYDWVLLNAPALSLLPEEQVLARLTDGSVFVIGASTPFSMIDGAITELGRDRIVGTVLVGSEERFPHPATR